MARPVAIVRHHGEDIRGFCWSPSYLAACIVCVFVVGFVYTWVEMIAVVFGHTGDVCADATGPDAGHITRLLWWSKAVLWIQISMVGCGCCGALGVAMVAEGE